MNKPQEVNVRHRRYIQAVKEGHEYTRGTKEVQESSKEGTGTLCYRR